MILQVALTRAAERHQSDSSPICRCEVARSHQREVRQLARRQLLDRETSEALVWRHNGRMLAVARRLLRSEEDAADAVQDAFVSALAAIHKFQGRAQLYTWLHRIVVNACLMKLRSNKRCGAVSLDELLPSFDENGCHAHAVATRGDQALARLEQDEVRTLVRQCIDRLPDEYRTILILRDIEEFDTEQTSMLLDLSQSAVKTRLHRARQALRTLLEQVVMY
jgi:RNA polymerase sigma-70 factor (ECF subfamily)